MACARVSPHISCDGFRLLHTAGRSGCPKMRQRWSSSNCIQRSPAAFPFGIPGIGDEMDGAIQQAPHALRHCNGFMKILFRIDRLSSRSGLAQF
jgi:hypothetical protein